MLGKRFLGKLFFTGIVLMAIYACVFKLFDRTKSPIVNIALRENGKTYIFSLMTSEQVQHQISKHKSPVALPFLKLYSEDKTLYIEPEHIKEIVNVLCGNYTLHDYPEQSFDGYVTNGPSDCGKHSVHNTTTEKIGEQVLHHNYYFTHPETKNSMAIRWKLNPSTGEIQALENCSEKAFRITENPHPGETYTFSKKFVVVDLNYLTHFFGKGINLELEAENQLLYIYAND